MLARTRNLNDVLPLIVILYLEDLDAAASGKQPAMNAEIICVSDVGKCGMKATALAMNLHNG